LEVPPNPIAYWLSFWTPQLVRSWLQRLLPEWFLPTSVILKERNPYNANGYENEIATYQHLQHLQGHCIPRMFGEAFSYDNERARYQMSKRPIPAILLEKIEGVSLHSLPIRELASPRLLEELQAPIRPADEKLGCSWGC